MGVAAVLTLVTWQIPREDVISQYKMLSYVRSCPGTEVIHQALGPLGRIDVVAGRSIHYAPGLSLQYTGDIPPHVLMITDGDQTSAVYDCKQRDDWTFMDHTTAAAGYYLCDRPRVLILGAGGGVDIGLATYHESREIVALEMNPQVIKLMTGPLGGRGGGIYRAKGVSVLNREARGYLASGGHDEGKFDIIQLPAIDAFGASGAGLYATQESYLYTVESLELMLRRLRKKGVLCITRWARTPPRDGLRIFDTAAEALRKLHLDPSKHLGMIRSWATVTVLVSRSPFTAREVDALKRFCRQRSFDLCYLPALAESEANRYHVLDQPYYFRGARALLGQHRDAYLDDY
ncbi:MAG: SAM-dependent methyltransferase, partial [Candidatus Hydrogenedentes bacterium]|nr:SAM-dependent methyltransferase [Candidatus Hydrogenedentota bacterium]